VLEVLLAFQEAFLTHQQTHAEFFGLRGLRHFCSPLEFLGTLEGILEVKLPTIWADEKAEGGRAMQRREEKRREKKRRSKKTGEDRKEKESAVRRKKM
jgi:hypothetical protein